MTELATEIERATKNARSLAHSLGVRVFLYRDMASKPVILTIHPAETGAQLELIETFEPPAHTQYDSALPPSTS